MISGIRTEWAAAPFALLGLPLRWLSFTRRGDRTSEGRARTIEDDQARARRVTRERVLYHLGRGRRARDAGRFEDGAREARKALLVNPQSGWALALLGQCLTRQHRPDLYAARHALERAQALEPTNGYFVRLLLDVLEAQGDQQARADLLAWAWWHGAPVERWLPDGPPARRTGTGQETAAAARMASEFVDGAVSRDGDAATTSARDSVLAGR
jgi:hypothetical protein